MIIWRRAPVTYTLLALITAVFGLELLLGRETLFRAGAVIPIQYGEYYRFVTALFLHQGLLHFATNMWGLYQLGSLYEALFGPRRFLFVYFVSGIAASFASSLFGSRPSVGASGAIFGLLGAFIFSILRSPVYRHQPWVKSLIGQIIFWIVVNLAIGSQLEFVDNTAHIGGLFAGLLLGLIPHRVPPPPPSSQIIDARSRPYDDGF
jgi:rhomboid protease GluP